jgi:hypothetical protein
LLVSDESTVFIITQARTPFDAVPNNLALDSIRTGYPDARVVVVDASSCKPVRDSLEAESGWLDYDFVGTDAGDYSEALRLILKGHERTAAPISIVAATMRFWERCDRWSIDGLIAGRRIPAHLNESGDAVLSHLHYSHLIVPRPDKLNRAIRRFEVEAPDIDLFAPRTFFTGGRWERHEVAGFLTEALEDDAQSFSDEQLDAFDNLAYGYDIKEIPDKLSASDKRELIDRYWRVRADPTELQGAWRHEQAYYAKRAVERAA